RTSHCLTDGDCDPRDLPSFPTRRSSDLLTFTAKADDTYFCSVPGHRQAGMVGKIAVKGSDAKAVAEHDPHEMHMRPGAAGGSLKDRKSTRLNSSHVKISYAVFCLKKKKH